MELLNFDRESVNITFKQETTALIYSSNKTIFCENAPAALKEYVVKRLEEVLVEALHEGIRTFLSNNDNYFENQALKILADQRKLYPDIEVYKVYIALPFYKNRWKDYFPEAHNLLYNPPKSSSLSPQHVRFLVESSSRAVAFLAPGLYRLSVLGKALKASGKLGVNLYDERVQRMALRLPQLEEGENEPLQALSALASLPEYRFWAGIEKEAILEIQHIVGNSIDTQLKNLQRAHDGMIKTALLFEKK